MISLSGNENEGKYSAVVPEEVESAYPKVIISTGSCDITLITASDSS